MTRNDLRRLTRISKFGKGSELDFIYKIMVMASLKGIDYAFPSIYVSKNTIDELSKEFTLEIEKVGDKIKLNEISWN